MDAQEIVQSELGKEVTLSQPTVLKDWWRNLVIRCSVEGHSQGPRSVIVKHIREDDACGFSDWASLQFLSKYETTAGVAPRFIGGDVAKKLFVMEDLGPSHTLAGLLERGRAEEILTALRQLASTMARLVSETGQTLAEFETIRTALPAAEPTGRIPEVGLWAQRLRQIKKWSEVLGVDLPADFDEALHEVAHSFAEPGALLAFSHGDPAPSNNYIGEAGACLLDFEYGAPRHALYDLAAWNVLCPLPEAWLTALVTTFRAHVPDGPLTDTEWFTDAWGTMCAYRGLAMLSWMPIDILEEDASWVRNWTVRQAMISTASRTHVATAVVPRLGPIAQATERFLARLRGRWPELGDGRIDWPGST